MLNMKIFSALLPLFLLTLPASVLGATSDQNCIASCSTWSVVLGFCRGIYGNAPQQDNATFANEFVSCLCAGSEYPGAIGNTTFLADAGTCESCPSTPSLVQSDLSTLLYLCAVQAKNGTSSGASTFTPIGYTTSENTGDSYGISDSGAGRKFSKEMWIGMLVICGLGVLVVGLR